MTPLRVVLGLNVLVVLASYAAAYTFNYGGDAQFIAVLAPFTIATVDLCLGVLCLILMGILNVTGHKAAMLTDKYMQAFMISFGVVFAFAVPACFIVLGHR